MAKMKDSKATAPTFELRPVDNAMDKLFEKADPAEAPDDLFGEGAEILRIGEPRPFETALALDGGAETTLDKRLSLLLDADEQSKSEASAGITTLLDYVKQHETDVTSSHRRSTSFPVEASQGSFNTALMRQGQLEVEEAALKKHEEEVEKEDQGEDDDEQIEPSEDRNEMDKTSELQEKAPFEGQAAQLKASLQQAFAPHDTNEHLVEFLHRQNVRYTRDAVLKHAIIAATQHDRSNEIKNIYSPLCTIQRSTQIRDDLARYHTAVENYQTWLKRTSDPSWANTYALQDPTTASVPLALLDLAAHFSDPSTAALSSSIFASIYDPSTADFAAQVSRCHDTPAIITRRRWWIRRDAFWGRLSMAVFGGLALVVPMLVMTLCEGRLVGLLTTSACVMGVACLLAWLMEDAAARDIVGATAAYAAVLVVFVGTGTATS